MSALPRGCLDEHLKISHLGDILDDLFDAREKWYYFGLRLKLKVPTLESVGASSSDSAGRFMKVLKEVLEGKGCQPVTRSHLVDALEAVTVGLPQLAKELREKYSTTPAGSQVVQVKGSESAPQNSSDDTSDAQDATSSSSGYESHSNGHIVVQTLPTDQPQIMAPASTDQRFEKLLKRKLRRTRTLYEVLLKRGHESFKRRMVPLHKIAEAAKTYHDQPGLGRAALRKMATMDEVWASFKEHTSWYNSEIVEAVVMLHGGDSDQKNLEEFKKDRTNLVRYLSENSDQGKKTQMILKLEEDFTQFSDERLEQVCLTLCDLLETKTCPLDVQEGCVKITMSIPAEVAEDIFPLSPAMTKAFQKAFPTLISISCGKIVETFETTEDTDDSLSLDGQENCLDEGFNEDEYFADGSGSDEEECGKKVESHKKTSMEGTSFLKILSILSGLTLLLVMAVLLAGLMWPYSSAQWNVSGASPVKDQDISLLYSGNWTDSHAMNNEDSPHHELHSEVMNRNHTAESPGLTPLTHGSWNSSGICYINWTKAHLYLPSHKEPPHPEMFSEGVSRSYVALSPGPTLHKCAVASRNLSTDCYAPLTLLILPSIWGKNTVNLMKNETEICMWTCKLHSSVSSNRRDTYYAELSSIILSPNFLTGKKRRLFISRCPQHCYSGCHPLSINGSDTCHENWLALIRFARLILSMLCGPDIQVTATSTQTPVPREAGNGCLRQWFNLARKERQTNCYHLSTFLGNITKQLLSQPPISGRKGQLPSRASCLFMNYHTIKCPPNYSEHCCITALFSNISQWHS